MQYITHTRFDGKDLSGKPVLIRRKRVLERRGDVLFYSDIPICVYRSLTGKRHFARNDDRRGMERGALTWALAYAPRNRSDGDGQRRFTEDEAETLRKRWGRYLKPGVDTLLFNDQFFEENPDVLREIAASVNVKAATLREE